MTLVKRPSRHSRQLRTLLVASALFGGISWAQTTDPVQVWLLSGCQVGEEGQPAAALQQYGTQGVPELISAAQNGPPAGMLSQLQADATASFAIIQSTLASAHTGAADPSYVAQAQAQTEAQFVAQETNRLVIFYEVRAVQGLATVVNQQGLQALLSLASSSPVPQVQQAALENLTLLADVNQDGVVSCADLALVKSSLGKKTGQAGFNQRADVNQDGVVSVLDLSFVARQLPAGTVCN